MRHGPLSAEQLARYDRAGYLLVDAMFDSEEIGLLLRSAKQDRALDEHSFAKDDGEGGKVRLSLWNHPGEGIYGMFARAGASSMPASRSSTTRSTIITRR